MLKQLNLAPNGIIIFGGRPGMGVTPFTLKLANQLAKDEKVLFISYQLHSKQLIKKLHKQEEAPKQNLIINTSLSFFYYSIDNELEELIKYHNASTVIIDDLDSLLGENYKLDIRDRQELINKLHTLSDKLQIRLILNVATSRKVHRRGGDMRPALQDLTWARNLIEVPQQIFTIYRPSYYAITEDEYGNSTEGQIDIECQLNHQGDEFSVELDNQNEKILPYLSVSN